ncbi:MAG TPA: nucleotide exchange factor GrpE [Firmicutes bacterium]|jgi:molecular chaperone GrpE|nr:nucleotide exchange factor GrpE [Bacillota bacterium]
MGPEERKKEQETVPEEGLQTDLETELETARQEAEEYLDHLRRLQAEFDNYRKRVRAERADWDRQTKADVFRKLLPVLDNFELALKAGEDNAGEFHKGVAMIHRQLLSILEEEGVTPIEAQNCPFDPNVHEAVMQVEAQEGVAADMVVEEVRRGYLFRERVLRAAMVKVSK